MFQKSTCINSGILSTSMTLSTDSKFKKKRFKLNLEIFRDIFKICPRVQGQDFDALPTDEEIMSFLRELGHTGKINSLNDLVVDNMNQPWRTFAALINKSLSRNTTGATPPKNVQKFKKPASPKLTSVPVLTEEPTGKSKRVKRHAKKSTTPSRGVVIRDTPEIPLSKKKEKVDVTQGVPNVTEEESSESEAESWGNDEDDNNNEHDLNGEDNDQENDSDDDKTQSDNENESDSEHETDKSESGSESDHEENEEHEEEVKDEFVKTPSNDSDDEDETNITDKTEGDEDEEMEYTTSQLYDDIIRLNEPVDTDKGFIQEEGTDAAMINTEVLVTSSSHSSDLAAKFLKFLDIPHTDAKIVSLMDVHVHQERSQKDKDEDPSVRSDRGLKKRKTSKDAKPTKGPKAKESQSGSSKGNNSHSKSFGKSIHSEEPKFEVVDSDMPQDQEVNPYFSAYIMNDLKITNLTQETLLRLAFRLLKGTRSNYTELEYDFEECYKALSEKLDWENPEGGDYPFDLTKTLPLVMNINRQMVDYFFNNDLKYLQGGISNMTYTNSLTKTKASQYDLPGIKDMVPNIWSPVKVLPNVLWQ
nr:hypothetical protein [Tanacetum cinerariifolium]